MNWGRIQTTAEVLWTRWTGRGRTVLRAVAIGLVALGGYNLLLGPSPILSGPFATGLYRPVLSTVTGGAGIPIVSEIVLIVVGLVSILVLSAFR